MVSGCVESCRDVAGAFVLVLGLGCCCRPMVNSPFGSSFCLYWFEDQFVVLGDCKFSFKRLVCAPKRPVPSRSHLPVRIRAGLLRVYRRIGYSLGLVLFGYLL